MRGTISTGIAQITHCQEAGKESGNDSYLDQGGRTKRPNWISRQMRTDVEVAASESGTTVVLLIVVHPFQPLSGLLG